MKNRRGKRIACWITGVGVLVLVACGVVFKDRIVEEWYLHRLRSGDLEEQKVAAERLTEIGSVRAVPLILEELRSSPERLLPVSTVLVGDIRGWQTSPEERDPFLSALREITKVRGKACVPYFVEALADENWALRHLASQVLGQIGPEAREAIPALTELRQDENETVRQAAAEALKKIQGHEEPER